MSDRTIPIGELCDVLLTVERSPRSQRGGRWTRAVRAWRRQLLAAGATDEEAEAELGRTFRLGYSTCFELREVMPLPENPKGKPLASFCRFTDGRKTKGARRAPRASSSTREAS